MRDADRLLQRCQTRFDRLRVGRAGVYPMDRSVHRPGDALFPAPAFKLCPLRLAPVKQLSVAVLDHNLDMAPARSGQPVQRLRERQADPGQSRNAVILL